MAPKVNHHAPVDDRKPDGAAQHSPRSSLPSPIPLPTKQEREGYYHSNIPLLARTSTDVWDPLGPDGSPKAKELSMTGVGHFGDGEQWHTVYSEMMNTLSTLGVSWTAIDPFRIGYEEEWDKPVIVLIGVDSYR